MNYGKLPHKVQISDIGTNKTYLSRNSMFIARFLSGEKHGATIICITTGGTADMTAAERVRVVPALKPELASFNMGSINFSIHPITERYKDEDYRYAWEKEFALGTKDFVFRNTFADIEHFCKIMRENNTKSEYEAYDIGHLYNISHLLRRNVIQLPIWLQFVTGILGGIGSSLEDIMYMKHTSDRLFGTENYQ